MEGLLVLATPLARFFVDSCLPILTSDTKWMSLHPSSFHIHLELLVEEFQSQIRLILVIALLPSTYTEFVSSVAVRFLIVTNATTMRRQDTR